MLKEEVDKMMNNFFEHQNVLCRFETEEERNQYIANNEAVLSKVSKFVKYLIDKNQFRLNYQPHVNQNGNWLGAEALFRMEYEGKKFYPDVVFSLAKYFGYEKELTLNVLDRVCKDIHQIKQETTPEFCVTYNVNPKLLDGQFCMLINHVVNQNGVSPSSVGIELLEISSFDDIKLCDINTLKRWGYKILIDDFGSGHANEDVLRKIPFDVVKFSEKVISGIDRPQNANNLKRVKDIISFCKAKHIQTIAEHVENEHEFDACKKLRIDKIQGWYFCKDLPVDEFIKKCKEHCK